MPDLRVLSAFPSGSRKLVEQYGLLSRKAILDNPEVLKAVVASRAGTQHAWKNEAAFIKEVKRKLKDKFWASSYEGPSAFFGPPDPAKIGPQHPTNVLNTKTLKINLTKLLAKEPKTVIHGSELVPYDPKGPKHQGNVRHHPISVEEARAYARTKPEILWKHYSDPKGRRYAGGVPHAHIITPSGIIPPEFLEF